MLLIVVDIDECSASSHRCGPAGMCVNVDDGTYTCTCDPGYEKVPADAGPGVDTVCTGKFLLASFNYFQQIITFHVTYNGNEIL